MAHIAIDARIINSSTGRYVERLISHLEKIDNINSYTILVRQKDVNFWKPSVANFRIKIADFDNYSLSEQIGFKAFLDHLRPDLVHFCMPQQPIFYNGKTVTTVHDLTLLNTYNSDKNWVIFHLKQQVGKFVFRRIARTNKHIITPSNFTKDAYQAFSRIDPKKITVTYEAADPPIKNSDALDLPFSQYILYVGQQSDYKNIPRLAKAHQLILQSHPGMGLVLAGKINQSARKNQQHFAKMGYKNIHFTDFIPDAQLAWLYQNATAYVFPSLMEGFGLPGLEAMQYGLPVVSSDATCLPEIYGEAAEYFTPTNTNDMAEKIRGVIDSPVRRNELIKQGLARAHGFSWHQMAAQTHAIYQQVLDA